MNVAKIIIIDYNEDRRKELKRQIEKYGVEVGIHSVTCRTEVFLNETDDHKSGTHDLSNKNKINWEPEWEEDLFDIDGFDLIFLHIGDNKFNSKFYKLKCEEKGLSNRVIGYTGGRHLFWYSNSNYLENVGAARDVADLFHFKDFFEDWLYNEQQNKEMFGVSWNSHKLKGGDFEYIPSISILCQGYLAVYAESGEYEGGGKIVEDALERMGWNFFKNKLPGSQTSLQVREKFKQNETITDVSWFRDIFDKKGMNKDTLTQEIKNEWGDYQEEGLDMVLKLIDALYDGDSANYTPLTVAGAYLAIAKKIGG